MMPMMPMLLQMMLRLPDNSVLWQKIDAFDDDDDSNDANAADDDANDIDNYDAVGVAVNDAIAEAIVRISLASAEEIRVPSVS